MAAIYDETPIVISEDDARGGVTGHNVRYVLTFGLTGVIAMFLLVAIYFGFDTLEARISAALNHSPYEVLKWLAPDAAIVLAGAIGAGLLLGIWNMVSGRSTDESQNFMRFRVAAQFALVCVIMALLYVSMA